MEDVAKEGELIPEGMRPGAWSGHIKNGGGRKPGSRNRFPKQLKEAILKALEAKGGVEYLIGIAETDPKSFCMLLARVLPLTVQGPDGGQVDIKVTVEYV